MLKKQNKIITDLDKFIYDLPKEDMAIINNHVHSFELLVGLIMERYDKDDEKLSVEDASNIASGLLEEVVTRISLGESLAFMKDNGDNTITVTSLNIVKP